MLARTIQRFSVVAKRGYAAAAPAANANPEELRLTFASPDTVSKYYLKTLFENQFTGCLQQCCRQAG